MLYNLQPTAIGLAVDLSVRLKFSLKVAQIVLKSLLFANFCNYLKNGSLFVPKLLQELKAQ